MCGLASAPHSANAQSQLQTIEIISEPTDANVRFLFWSDYSDIDIRKIINTEECNTPCQVKIQNGKGYSLIVTRLGYSPTTIENGLGKHTSAITQHIAKLITVDELAIRNKLMAEQIRLYGSKCYNLLKKLPNDNREAKPCKRPVPTKINKNGSCSFLFDITETGTTSNIRDIICTHKKLTKPTKQSVAKWQYLPARKNGLDVSQRDVKSRLDFRKK